MSPALASSAITSLAMPKSFGSHSPAPQHYRQPADLQAKLAFDRQHIWHPYSSANSTQPLFFIEGASGVHLRLADGRKLIDGMSSWWCAIHGYNHPVLNTAIESQLKAMSHVMFGGLTHQPAIDLAERLVRLTPDSLNRVFFADSGSVSVEVAIKMAIQYYQARGSAKKNRLLALRNGYHGDTFACMSVCDPVTGMHHLFKYSLIEQIFAPAPAEERLQQQLEELETLFVEHHHELAAFILEPIVQGAGGMRFYPPAYLERARALCDEHDVLLIADEIATGFGRTGTLFACEQAAIAPDILCLGKALTGGYMTLAATLCSDEIAEVISKGEAGAFMHGPTFMANPLACSVASASIDLLLKDDWKNKVAAIESWLLEDLMPLKGHSRVSDVRVKGAIGVLELEAPCDLAKLQPRLVDAGVWLRPFGKLLYTMPPFISERQHIAAIGRAMTRALG